MDGAEATLRSVAPEEVTSQDMTLQPLIGQKHSRCGSRSSSKQLMSLSGKNESLSPVPTLQCLRSKQQFKCVHVCLRAVSWASGHLRECGSVLTRTQCKPHPVRNRNRKFCSRFSEYLHVFHKSKGTGCSEMFFFSFDRNYHLMTVRRVGLHSLVMEKFIFLDHIFWNPKNSEFCIKCLIWKASLESVIFLFK